ncbi:MAG UNVERIFIED_CONTAM: hypothetical protein LVR29_30315 [Microcystis novacekii LVE1205-3]|jgi:hypothetical protein
MESHNSEPIIIAEAVEKWYDNRFHALRGVNLTVNKQEVVVIMRGPILVQENPPLSALLTGWNPIKKVALLLTG